MNATIYANKTIIGTADLHVGDASMGCVFGEFIPNDNYFNDIQKVVWEFWETNKPDYKKWHSLRFNVRLDNGYFLFPSGGYTFDDNPDSPNEPKRIDIAGISLDVLQLKSSLLIEPWTSISIEQKIAFEDELVREITPAKSPFDFFKRKDSHALVGATFSAFAKCEANDDVLFEIDKKGEKGRFACVHLTWIRGREKQSNSFPRTRFFHDFDDFIENEPSISR